VGAIAAGILGVALIAIITLGVWIRSKLISRPRGKNIKGRNHVDSSTVLSSISSSLNDQQGLEGIVNIDETQMESIRLDETEIFLNIESGMFH
jgi:hypothetical protein